MNQEQEQVKKWMAAYGQETPEKPCIPNAKTRILRAKLIYEEAVKELISALGVGIYVQNEDGEWDCIQDFAVEFRDWWGDRVPMSDLDKLKEIADGCEDLKVVTEGTLVACGLAVKMPDPTREECDDMMESELYAYYCQDPHFNEVMRSNWTKFWTLPEIKEHKRLLGYSVTNISSMNEDEMCNNDRCYLVKDKDGKVIKSPSYSPPNFKLD